MDADRYSARRVAATRSSIFYASLFAAREARPGLNAVFALCTELRAVTEISDPGVASTKLQWWRSEIRRALEGGGEHPLAPALARLDALPVEYFMQIADAAQMDIDRREYASLPELDLYLHLSGGVPATLAATILGYSEPATERFAQQLGSAVRLVEIIRGLRTDARHGRIYLPRERMAALAIQPSDLSSASTTPALARLLAELADTARKRHRQALDVLAPRERARQRPCIIAGALYMRLLDHIESSGFPVVEHTMSLSPARKLWLAWRTARRVHARGARWPSRQ